MGIGENIKEFRLDKGLTQNDLAKKAGISRVALGNYEREERIPSIEILKKIAIALDTSEEIIMKLQDYTLEEIYRLKIIDKKYVPLTKHQYRFLTEIIDKCTSNILNSASSVDYYDRAYMYIFLNNYEDAIKDYTKAIQLNPKFAFAYLDRGNLYAFLGHKQNAFNDYDKAFEVAPNRDVKCTIFNSSSEVLYKTLGEHIPKNDIDSYILEKKEIYFKKTDSPLANKINLLNDDCIDLISNLVDKLIKDKNNLR
ncbi:helix-turn-helix family protein [Clostridioides difficile CD149]|uniref:helix-turn-helix domain-containing protein n=1 Tax=Clostridioides difficile TaxID=1496 RepID=UPI00038D4EF5|nr:helix-turn-helix transcriptional regulator [Clostridioides difficile]EGT3961193.1 helix-turn-helix domain-containing protein [Clostridioides difficile]EGT4016822.1 helix-turn-helix domain-containing protein [Clostridioides difficile]EGT4203275.1 helix-turn-helix domain-containing protein [Clostridioides difficile]EJA6629751.1 helix-turn-helix domain-containing protein [Clostridioides difficile]EJA6847591.1 helix-turn-helix domain-containing protein [Clostridioides difficile]